MKKILILINHDAGLYYQRKELIEKLIKDGNEVHISLPNGANIENLKKLGCIFHDTYINRRGTNIIKDFKLFLKYLKMIKQIKPDAVLTYTIKPNIYGGMASKIRKIPYIANVTGLGTALENEGVIQKLSIFLYKIALKKVKCCFVQNEGNLQFLKNHKILKDESKYKLIPGSGVNLEKFKILDYPKKDDKINFLFISRIMKEKGIDYYLETAKYIKEKYKNTEFYILGFCEEEYEKRLKDLQEQGIIKYEGRQNDIIPYLKISSCVIHPSYYPEGMSNVLLEASASGRPIITTNRNGCKEAVDDGKTGFIVETKNLEQLKEKVEMFINMPNEERKQMGISARKKMEKEFDRNIVINAYMKELNN